MFWLMYVHFLITECVFTVYRALPRMAHIKDQRQCRAETRRALGQLNIPAPPGNTHVVFHLPKNCLS